MRSPRSFGFNRNLQGKTGTGVRRAKEGETGARSYVQSSKSNPMRRIKLANHQVELQPDVLYEWSVAIVPDAENRSKDVIAKGVIQRISAPGDLDKRVQTPTDTEKAAVYAEAGIWYDPLKAIKRD